MNTPLTSNKDALVSAINSDLDYINSQAELCDKYFHKEFRTQQFYSDIFDQSRSLNFPSKKNYVQKANYIGALLNASQMIPKCISKENDPAHQQWLIFACIIFELGTTSAFLRQFDQDMKIENGTPIYILLEGLNKANIRNIRNAIAHQTVESTKSSFIFFDWNNKTNTVKTASLSNCDISLIMTVFRCSAFSIALGLSPDMENLHPNHKM